MIQGQGAHSMEKGRRSSMTLIKRWAMEQCRVEQEGREERESVKDRNKEESIIFLPLANQPGP